MPPEPLRPALLRDKEHAEYVKIDDLDAAGYLFFKKLAIVTANELRPGYYEFVFYDPEYLADSYVMDYVNSAFSEYSDAVRRLKKVIHRFRGGNRGHHESPQRKVP